MNESHESFRQFVVASGNSAEFFDAAKEPFHLLPALPRRPFLQLGSLMLAFGNGHRGSEGVCRRLKDLVTSLARLAIQG